MKAAIGTISDVYATFSTDKLRERAGDVDVETCMEGIQIGMPKASLASQGQPRPAWDGLTRLLHLSVVRGG